MARFVLTLSGEDRAGLVAAVADAVAAHGGNWEGSQLAERAGVFAGVVEVTVPDSAADDLLAAVRELGGLLTVTTVGGAEVRSAGSVPTLAITVLANDRPGIIREISGVLSAHGVSIDELSTDVRDAAMAGGRLFEASMRAHADAGTDPAAVRRDLERLAAELQVEISLED